MSDGSPQKAKEPSLDDFLALGMSLTEALAAWREAMTNYDRSFSRSFISSSSRRILPS